MDAREEKLKGLPSGVVVSAVFDREIGTLNALALYSPGVKQTSGTFEQMVRWCIALHQCSGGQYVYGAFAYMSPGPRELAELNLKSLRGLNVLYAVEKTHLLEGLGLADSSQLADHPGWMELQDHVCPVQIDISEFETYKSFFDHDLARKCQAARAKMKRSEGN